MTDTTRTGGGWKDSISLLLGLTGLLMGCVGAYYGITARGDVDDLRLNLADTAEGDEEMIGTLGGEVKDLRADVQAANKRISGVARVAQVSHPKLQEIIRRLQVLEQIELKDGKVVLPGGTPVDVPQSLGAVGYEQMRDVVLSRSVEDQVQWVFVAEVRRHGRLATFEQELVERIAKSTDRPWLDGLLEKTREMLRIEEKDE